MDDLPLELKQRVCSYLAPKDLESLRSTSRFYAAATDRYLLPRIFLSNHPDSFQEIKEITDNPELIYSVTTLVVDTSCLPLYPKYGRWASHFAHPKAEAADPQVARAERVLRRGINRAQWMKYQECAMAQRDSRRSMLDSIALAFQKCPKLSNLVIECYGQDMDSPRTNEKQERFHRDVHPVAAGDWVEFNRWFLESMQFDIWDMLKPAHDVNRVLDSLVLLDMRTTCDQKFPTTTIFDSLKHLRYRGSSASFLPQIVACAPELESIGILGRYNNFDKFILQSLVGRSVLKNLRACSLNVLAFDENDLASFLLRHSDTLQTLRIAGGNRAAYAIDWRSFATQVRGELPNLRRLEISDLMAMHQMHQLGGWVVRLPITGADILQDHGHDLETGPMEIEDGLWEDYEKMFFPDKCKP